MITIFYTALAIGIIWFAYNHGHAEGYKEAILPALKPGVWVTIKKPIKARDSIPGKEITIPIGIKGILMSSGSPNAFNLWLDEDHVYIMGRKRIFGIKTYWHLKVFEGRLDSSMIKTEKELKAHQEETDAHLANALGGF